MSQVQLGDFHCHVGAGMRIPRGDHCLWLQRPEVERSRTEAKKRLVTWCVFKVVTTRSYLHSTSNLVSPSFSEVQVTDIITLGLQDEIGQ